jgi:isocitrate dehydrogenase
LAKALTENEQIIVNELRSVQGQPVDIGGYYLPSHDLLQAAMRPSATFNALIEAAKS